MLLPEFDIKIMQVVKILRNYKGIKQSTIANTLKIDRTCYGRIENGTQSYTPSQLEQIANELQISINDILDFVKQNSNINQNSLELLENVLKHFNLISNSSREDTPQKNKTSTQN